MMLKLDFDTTHTLTMADLAARASRAGVKVRALALERSPSGRGWHAWLKVSPQPRTAVETVALQLIFGSDVLRECYNLSRARQVDAGAVPRFWRGRWNVLYRRDHGENGRA